MFQTTTGAAWRDQSATAEALLRHVNAETSAAWRLESRFAGGVLQGAWRVRDGSNVAVLKWHDSTSTTATVNTEGFNEHVPYNPDAPAIVDYLRSAGYPTPAWLAAGTTAEGIAWSIQEFVEGETLRELDRAAAAMVIDLVRLQRTLRLPTSMSWNPYIRAHVFGNHRSHRQLTGASDHVRGLLAAALALAAPHESAMLVEDEMVHCDLSVSNLVVCDGRLVAVVDVDGTGRGCAAIAQLVNYAVEAYGPAPVAINAACLAVETTSWYLTTSAPVHIEAPVARLVDWIENLDAHLH
jgi:hypothetical protein